MKFLWVFILRSKQTSTCSKYTTMHFKICGIQSLEEALFCEDRGIDFIGFNFVKNSKRYINPMIAKEIASKLTIIKKVGIFVDEDIELVNKMANEIPLDLIQLHGEENLDYIEKSHKSVIKAFRIGKTWPDLKKFNSKKIAYFLFDGAGNGQNWSYDLIKDKVIEKPFFIAGGVNTENAIDISKKLHPFGLDLASGVEEPRGSGQKSTQKINKILALFNSSC